MKDRSGLRATSQGPLLTLDDSAPVVAYNPAGASPFLLIGDHAGDAIPARLETLGVAAADRARHIALDIGVAALGCRMADRLDAVFLRQHYSRLVIDCNRDPGSPAAIPRASDGTAIPGNAIAPEEAAERIAAIHAPYQAAIGVELDRRADGGMPTILVSLHSFTPVMAGVRRPWHVGVLHDRGDAGPARALLARLAAVPGLIVGDNEPYRMDETDFTVPYHAWPRGLPYAEIEVRQDLLADDAGVAAMAATLCAALKAA